MTFMKLIFTLALGFFLAKRVVHAERTACDQAAVDAWLECYNNDDSSGPCGVLPIPDKVFQSNPNPYDIQTLRRDEQGNLYTITAGAYWMMAALAKGRSDNTGSSKTGSSRSYYSHSSKGSSSSSGKGGSRRKLGEEKKECYTLAVFDFPEGNFVIRDTESGEVIGSLVTAALHDILFEMNGLTPDQICEVQLVYSHGHFDHIGAATITYEHIKANYGDPYVDIIAHVGVLEEFEERIAYNNFYSYRAPLPTLTIHEETTFRVGDYGLEYTLTPTKGHQDMKDLVIFFEATKEAPAVMMYVDVIFPGWAPFFKFGITVDLFDYLAVHDELLDKYDLGDDGIFIGGHLTQMGTREDIQVSKDFTLAVLNGAAEGLATVDFNALAAASGVGDPTDNRLGNLWYLFGVYFEEIIKVCTNKVVAEYGCKLAGVDIVIHSLCDDAQSFWRVDY